MYECLPKHSLMHGNSKNDIRTRTSMELSKANTKKRSLDGLSLPNQNTILINII